MMKYGRNEKMTFCIFVGHKRHKLFWGIFIFIMGVPQLSFLVASFLLTSLRQDYLLRSTLPRLSIFNGENCSGVCS